MMKPVKYSEMLKNNKLTKFRLVKDIVDEDTVSNGYVNDRDLKGKDEKSKQLLLDRF